MPVRGSNSGPGEHNSKLQSPYFVLIFAKICYERRNCYTRQTA